MKFFILAFVLCVCPRHVENFVKMMSTSNVDMTGSMDVTNDTESCENEDTGLNETISNIHFDPQNE